MSYTKLLYHIVFRTKGSRLSITEAYADELYRYIWGFCKKQGCILHRIGGMPDHVHMLLEIPPTLAVADFMREVKTSAHRFVSDHKDLFPMFDGWGKSYCALSYGLKDKDTIKNYIAGQKEHHRKTTFAEELRKLLEENGVEYDKVYFLKE